MARIDARLADAQARRNEYEELVLTLLLACQEIGEVAVRISVWGGDYNTFGDYRERSLEIFQTNLRAIRSVLSSTAWL